MQSTTTTHGRLLLTESTASSIKTATACVEHSVRGGTIALLVLNHWPVPGCEPPVEKDDEPSATVSNGTVESAQVACTWLQFAVPTPA
jgi:hypothetical protein